MRAILVSVDYGDLLAITLPYNRHHFTDILVVTTPNDGETLAVALENGCQVYATDCFYDDGALYNKWKALEKGLDELGREGLICILDADILWPREIPKIDYQRGCLYTPPRRLHVDVTKPVPVESRWNCQPLFNDKEWAGYSQIFWAEDEHLPKPPWHEQDWLHGGGADSRFQSLWPASQRLRPGFTVLHLGSPGANWAGRVGQRVDGSIPAAATRRRAALTSLLARRATAPTEAPYAAERGIGSLRGGLEPKHS